MWILKLSAMTVLWDHRTRLDGKSGNEFRNTECGPGARNEYSKLAPLLFIYSEWEKNGESCLRVWVFLSNLGASRWAWKTRGDSRKDQKMSMKWNSWVRATWRSELPFDQVSKRDQRWKWTQQSCLGGPWNRWGQHHHVGYGNTNLKEEKTVGCEHQEHVRSKRKIVSSVNKCIKS